jgi:hypothetical protein
MKILFAVLALFAFGFASVGCSTVTNAIDRLSDDELAAYLQTGAKDATKFGIAYAQKKYPDKAPQIKADGKNADVALRGTIIPSFSGASTGDVARAAVDQAIAFLANKLSSAQIDGLVLVANTVITLVPMPKNPTDKLSPRLKKAVAAFFTGMAEGDEEALGIPGPAPAPNPAPAPTPPPPAPQK